MDKKNQHSVVDLTYNDKNQAVEIHNYNATTINYCASICGYSELNATLPWDGLLTLGEGESSDTVFIIK